MLPISHNIDFTTAPVTEVEAEVGRRLEGVRLAANISQAQLAELAGVSRRTITRLESGSGVSFETLIRVLRALGIANRIDTLVPAPGIRPIDRIRRGGKQRQRARPGDTDAATAWTWGNAPVHDETE